MFEAYCQVGQPFLCVCCCTFSPLPCFLLYLKIKFENLKKKKKKNGKQGKQNKILKF